MTPDAQWCCAVVYRKLVAFSPSSWAARAAFAAPELKQSAQRFASSCNLILRLCGAERLPTRDQLSLLPFASRAKDYARRADRLLAILAVK